MIGQPRVQLLVGVAVVVAAAATWLLLAARMAPRAPAPVAGAEAPRPDAVNATPIAAPVATTVDPIATAIVERGRREVDAAIGAVAGHVRWHDGVPAEQASIVCRARFPLEPARYRARSEADGSFRIESVPFGVYDVECEHADCAVPAFAELRHGAAGAPLELVVTRGLSIDGTLEVTSESRARPTGNLTLRAFGDARRHGSCAVERDGTFRIGGLAPGRYEIVLWERDLALVEPCIAHAGQSGVVLRGMRGTSALHGRVTDVHGRALPAFRVEVREALAGLPVRRRSEAGRRGEYDIEDLPAGRYEVVVSAEGATSASRTIELAAGAEATFDAQLEWLPAIEGRVLDAAGRPIEGADVHALGGFDEPVLDVGHGVFFARLEPHQRSLAHARSNADGRFRMPGLPEVRGFSVEHGDHVTLEWSVAGSPREPIALRMHAGATVSGRLVGTLAKAPRDLLLVKSGAPRTTGARHADSAFDGSFRFAGVGPGEWELHLVGWQQALLLRRFAVEDAPVDLGIVELDLDR